jgi:hypothetical protein
MGEWLQDEEAQADAGFAEVAGAQAEAGAVVGGYGGEC